MCTMFLFGVFLIYGNVVYVIRVEAGVCTVRLRGMETAISETSKRVFICSFATLCTLSEASKRVSIFDRETRNS